MTAILDVILATVAGALVILTILFSIFNIQQMSYNVQIFLTLDAAAKEVSTILEHFLDEAGYNIAPNDAIFTRAEPNRMTFNWKNTYDTGPNVIYDIYVQEVPGARDVERYYIVVDINSARRYDTEPFYLAGENIFTYLDVNGAEIDDPADNLSSIYGCRVDMELIHLGWINDPEGRILYPLTFWRYFKNIYLKDFAA